MYTPKCENGGMKSWRHFVFCGILWGMDFFLRLLIVYVCGPVALGTAKQPTRWVTVNQVKSEVLCPVLCMRVSPRLCAVKLVQCPWRNHGNTVFVVLCMNQLVHDTVSFIHYLMPLENSKRVRKRWAQSVQRYRIVVCESGEHTQHSRLHGGCAYS